MTRDEAHATLFKGQANVAKTAALVGVTTEELKQSFARYAASIPLDDDAWRRDVDLAWPWC